MRKEFFPAILLKAERRRKRSVLVYVVFVFFFTAGIVLSFLFMNRTNRILFEVIASFCAVLLGAGSFAYFVSYYVPAKKEIAFYRSLSGKPVLKTGKGSFVLTDEILRRNGIRFFVLTGEFGGEKRVFLLSETQRNALRGETIVSLEVSGEFVIDAEVSPC